MLKETIVRILLIVGVLIELLIIGHRWLDHTINDAVKEAIIMEQEHVGE